MHDSVCLQCNKLHTGPSNRLVRDSCGHEKCRFCLLEDENQCKQCVEEKKLRLHESEKNNENLENDTKDEVVNNHTGVIQVNGNVPSTSTYNGELTFHETIETLENKTLENSFNENTYDSLKVENKNIAASRIKKPDKQRRTYNTVIIPKHVTVISDPPSYLCTICNKNFNTKTHIKYHTYCNGTAKPYKCEHCGKEFILRAQLDVHSYKHKPVKPYSCSICKKSFSVRSKLTRHLATHSQVKSHICSICGNAYRSKESLKIHFIIHKSDKPFSCNICSAKFSNQSNLNKHSAVHTKEKAHMCDLCGKRYKLKWALSVHKLSHNKTRSFECSVCYKKFIYKKDLQRHSLIHEESKQYKCSVCSTTFRRQDNLRRHMKNTHPGKKAEVIKTVVPARSKILSTTNLTPNTSSVNNNKTDTHIPVDNPNAINVITTASVACSSIKINKEETEAVTHLPSAVKSVSRADATGGTATTTSVINGPIKLAFKTPAFKSYYNINRDFDHMPTVQLQSNYNMAESVEICQKILSTDSSLSSRNMIPKTDSISQEICQKILDPNSRPIHYETSFQNKQHAMIKNIKFKVPIQYTNQFKENGKVEETKNDDCSLNFTELQPVAMTSVIVNSNDLSESGNLYWRRRTSQNLSLKK
ncbi:zinc finger protein 154-like [Diorhabda sublineata]|uniref:zinc finger protein 154-like n=1 Tax=Diorhabda sublineata TaxID=1163346 RepID=UPI0024E0B4EF|nr:zinc finger protein 154-like [Diorhabda sublineata]